MRVCACVDVCVCGCVYVCRKDERGQLKMKIDMSDQIVANFEIGDNSNDDRSSYPTF